MRNDRIELCALIVLLGLTACNKPASDNADAPADTVAPAPDNVSAGLTRGIVQLESTPPRITRCGAADTLSLADPGGKLDAARKLLGGVAQASQELFISARAQSSSGAQLTIDDVLYLSPEKFDCFADWQSFDYRATGNNPGWVAEVRGNSVKLERQGAAPAEWSNASRDSTANGIRVTASGADGNSFELQLQRRSCANSVSGAYSAWSAQVTTAGTVLKGCSVNGG